MTAEDTTYLIDLRRYLHRHPELSGDEKWTSLKIVDELGKTDPDEIITGLGGYGVAAVFGQGNGPAVMLRSELDALTVTESEQNSNRSLNDGVSHACGHDGHMAILVGVARELSGNPPVNGRVVLLFQPSEETGEGAQRVIEDSRYRKMNVGRCYAVHNLPGYEAGTLFIREGPFAAASVGMKCHLSGLSSHAAFPDLGRNPVRILPDLIRFIDEANRPDITSRDYAIATITYISLGKKAFGITPGHAEIGLTLRAGTDENLSELSNRIHKQMENLADRSGLEFQAELTEPFAATVNSPACVEIVGTAAFAAGLPLNNLEAPFPWSEDFGRFSGECEGALIGLGAGIGSPHLHAENYEFNDDIIATGTTLMLQIIEEELKNLNA